MHFRTPHLGSHSPSIGHTIFSLSFIPLRPRLRSHQPCIAARLPHCHRANYLPLYVACGHPTLTLQLANHHTPDHSTTTRNSFSSHLRSPGLSCPFSTHHLTKPSNNLPSNHSSTVSFLQNARHVGKIDYDGSYASICTSGPALCCAFC
jgi:hypothetical protein